MFYDPDSMIGKELFRNRTYEPYTTEVIRQTLSEGMAFVDVGANIGWFTAKASKLVGETGKVYAFEPEPTNFRLLVQNCKANHLENVHLSDSALSDHKGRGQLYLHPSNSGGHSLNRVGRISPALDIQVSTLDDELAGEGIGVAKIDAEGAEVEILRGMRKTAGTSPDMKLIIECNPSVLKRGGHTPQDLAGELEKCGFAKVMRISEQERKLSPIDLEALRLSTNLFCSKA